MIENKLIEFMIYAFVGLILTLALPILGRAELIQAQTNSKQVTKEPKWINTILGLSGICIIPKLPWYYVIFSLAFTLLIGLLIKKPLKQTLPAIFFGLMVSSTLPWWLHNSNHLIIQGWKSVAVLSVTTLVFWMLSQETITEKKSNINLRYIIYAFFAFLGIYLSFQTGTNLTASVGFTAWHHWGAYIGPAQLINAGVYPLYDIPIQYGLGPTLITAIGCQTNYWNSFYWITGIATLLMTSVISYLALFFNPSRQPAFIFAILTIILVCCTCWNSYPPEYSSPLTYPSTSGIRFLPGILFLLVLIRHAKQALLSNIISKPPVYGHFLWLTCIIWSPEAGIHASVLWITYFIWLNCAQQTNQSLLFSFGKQVLIILFVLAIGLAIFGICYHLLLDVWPNPSIYAAYILHPPGPLPINPRGTFLFAVSTLVLWLLSLYKIREIGIAIITSWLVALLSFTTFTYYLGRSHDNNILNLLPFLALTLIATLNITRTDGLKAACTAMLSSLIGWLILFGWGSFQKSFDSGKLFSFEPQLMTSAFNRNSDQGKLLMGSLTVKHSLKPEDAIEALKYIRLTYHEPVEIYDLYLLVDSGDEFTPWNALHGPENFVSIPAADRKIYLSRVAKRLNKPGWVLYANNWDITEDLINYTSIYQKSSEIDFGTYKAIRYQPKPSLTNLIN